MIQKLWISLWKSYVTYKLMASEETARTVQHEWVIAP